MFGPWPLFWPSFIGTCSAPFGLVSFGNSKIFPGWGRKPEARPPDPLLLLLLWHGWLYAHARKRHRVTMLTHISRTRTYVRSAKCNIFGGIFYQIFPHLWFCYFSVTFVVCSCARRLSEGELDCSAGRMFTLAILSLGRFGLKYFLCFLPSVSCSPRYSVSYFILLLCVYTFPAFLITKLEVRNQLNQLFVEGKENISFVGTEFIKTSF
jgi:hypothetical protein